MSAFIDTNVLIWDLTGDPPELAARAAAYLQVEQELYLADLVVAETVYGSPAFPTTDARELMRRFGDAQPESRIGSWIDTRHRTGEEVALALEDAGYLKVRLVRDGDT